ncbi:hypothetical protein HaLaN_01020 [Haematococcus lacustris]|uniref:Uncharacterized protein n=1 Tax=Haematococcus lacustris TaxID=44745 RepID=A0A699Y890_HAELA|nr:hypothetical protein HaLaN_01020 [Haematococcus lacustris]
MVPTPVLEVAESFTPLVPGSQGYSTGQAPLPGRQQCCAQYQLATKLGSPAVEGGGAHERGREPEATVRSLAA